MRHGSPHPYVKVQPEPAVHRVEHAIHTAIEYAQREVSVRLLSSLADSVDLAGVRSRRWRSTWERWRQFIRWFMHECRQTLRRCLRNTGTQQQSYWQYTAPSLTAGGTGVALP